MTIRRLGIVIAASFVVAACRDQNPTEPPASTTTGSFELELPETVLAGQPFTLTVTNLASGNYLILAKAFDDQGATACAPEVLVRLNAPPRLRVVRGPAIVPNPASTDKTLTLRLLNGNEEKSYDVEASADLGTWTHVGKIGASADPFGGAFQISEPTDSHRFYRVVSR